MDVGSYNTCKKTAVYIVMQISVKNCCFKSFKT
ncbi:MAG: hypothetical protein L6V93_09985 [Clostridiales bacterium]|nr:MAG: hypothetical protein L6V93_09985 [Clostridiales bacterium]